MSEKTNKTKAQETDRPNSGTAKPGERGTYKDAMGSDGISFTYLKTGQTIKLRDQFEVIKTISIQTGEAFVYLCRNTNLNKKVILKLYLPGKSPKKEILDIFIKNHHEDIVDIYDYGEFNGQFYEIMEYAEGGTLDARLQQRPYTEEELKSIIKEILNGLVFLHSHNIVHRDIKPSNIFYRLGGERDVILGDIGTASILGELSRKITDAAWTLTFAPPEAYGVLVEDEVTKKREYKAIITREADYYSLGITLLCLIGHNPFIGLDPAEIQYRKTSEKREKLIPENISSEFKQLLRGLLTKVREDRWRSDQIQRWLNGEDVPVVPDEIVQDYKPKISPYKLKGVEADSPEKLAVLLQTYRDAQLLKEHLGRKFFSTWLAAFDQDKAIEVANVEEKVKDSDLALFEISCILDPNVPYFLTPEQSAVTPQKLAALMDKNWELGKEHFTSGRVAIWLKYTPGGDSILKKWQDWKNITR